jgi:hypothetical protein
MTKTPQKTGKRSSRAGVVVVVGALIVFGIIAYIVFLPGDEEVCLNLLPRKAQVGFSGDATRASVNIGALQESTGANPEQIAGFIECLKAAKTQRTVTISNGVVIRRTPIGEISNAWKREQGLQVSLEPTPGATEANKVLQNLAIGPAAGTKAAVIRSWCTVQAQACVTCVPAQCRKLATR